MESFCCGNPLEIRYHYRHNAAYDGIIVVDQKFFEKYSSISEKIKVGLKICFQCKTMIENSLSDHLDNGDFPTLQPHSSENSNNFSDKLKVKGQDTCCNPFNKKDHTGKKFRIVTSQMVNKLSSESVQLFVNDKICSTCRADLYRKNKTTKFPQSNHNESPMSARSR